ncbi:hypothetical protein L1987_59087 [Smallanthus sonchifolius]|uniref:Uncharacterized protein n=1 Tax=Smallanthus sonchifolius TaxID=185202 RepID=A0ACB9D4I7_9ASTR|nr:hypothetical protein L1987_59087 [Smallanthus sonchifolius]
MSSTTLIQSSKVAIDDSFQGTTSWRSSSNPFLTLSSELILIAFSVLAAFYALAQKREEKLMETWSYNLNGGESESYSF